MVDQRPLPVIDAVVAVCRCAWVTTRLLVQRRIQLRDGRLGEVVRFADGTSSRIYRETVVAGVTVSDPCALVVEFRLRGVKGRGHVLFRWESLFNTPLFVGFPGFVSKLWLAHNEHGYYKGVYEWDGPARAEAYARALWRVLALVSVPGSIRYKVISGMRRDQLFGMPTEEATAEAGWWRPQEPSGHV
jgi:hypothetical protein